jgi:hypothetical protein
LGLVNKHDTASRADAVRLPIRDGCPPLEVSNRRIIRDHLFVLGRDAAFYGGEPASNVSTVLRSSSVILEASHFMRSVKVPSRP